MEVLLFEEVHGSGARMQRSYKILSTPLQALSDSSDEDDCTTPFKSEEGSVCCVCGDTFPSLNKLTEHFKTHTDDVYCHLCKTKFGRVMSLALHLKNAHPQQSFMCEKCCVVVKCTWHMNGHIGRHQKDAMQAKPVENGIKETTRDTDVRKTTSGVHSYCASEQAATNDTCNASQNCIDNDAGSTNQASHIITETESLPVIDKQNDTFSFSSYPLSQEQDHLSFILKEENGNEHGLRESTTCEVAAEVEVGLMEDDESTDNANKENPNSLPLADTPYIPEENFGSVCCVCGDTFPFLNKLTQHFKTHTGDVYCHLCRTNFGSVLSLSIHLKYAHIQQWYMCGKCGALFNCTWRLNGHLEIHRKDAMQVEPVEISTTETTRHDGMRKLIMMFHSYCVSGQAPTNDNCNASQDCINSDINSTNQALHIETETESLPAIDRQNDTFSFSSCPSSQEQEHQSFTLKEENDNELRKSRTSKVAAEVEVGLKENNESTDSIDKENPDSLPPGDRPYIPEEDFCSDLEDSDSRSSSNCRKKLKLACCLCNVPCENGDLLLKHLTEKHPTAAYICAYCYNVFPLQDSFKKHVCLKRPRGGIDLPGTPVTQLPIVPSSDNSGQVKPAPTPLQALSDSTNEDDCTMPFKSEEGSVGCVCRDTFPSMDKLMEHFKTHTAEVLCHLCQTKFGSVMSLALHLKNAHPQQCFMCEECGALFKCTWRLIGHIEKHRKDTMQVKPVETFIKGTTRNTDVRKTTSGVHSYCASEQAAMNDTCNAGQNCVDSDADSTNQASHIKTETESLPIIDKQNDTFSFSSCPLSQAQEHLSFTLKEENDNKHRLRRRKTSKVAAEVEVGLKENNESTDSEDEENPDSLPPGDTPYIPEEDFCSDLEDSDSRSSSYGHHRNKKRQKKQTSDRNRPANMNLESVDIMKKFGFQSDSPFCCNGKFANLEKHMDDCRKELNLACCLCNMPCENGELLLKHLTEKHPTAAYICAYCYNVFPLQDSFKKHVCLKRPRGGIDLPGTPVTQLPVVPSSDSSGQVKLSAPTPLQALSDSSNEDDCTMPFKSEEGSVGCVCGDTFPSMDKLMEHFKTHPAEVRCHLCKTKCGSVMLLALHLKNAHPQQCFMCDKCGALFKCTWRLIGHLKKHQKDTMQVKPVEIGIKDTTRDTDVRKTTSGVHSYCASEQAAMNDTCNASQNCIDNDAGSTNQASHIKTETESLPIINKQNDTSFSSCPLGQEQEHLSFILKEENGNEHRLRESTTCEVAAEEEVGLTGDYKSADNENEEKPNSLPHCDTPYIPEEDLKSNSYCQHRNEKRQKKSTPDGNGPANTNLESVEEGSVCCVCGDTVLFLTEHFKTHTAEVHCHLCRTKFGRVMSLALHLKYAHPQQRYKCEKCGALFKCAWRLNGHIENHRKDAMQVKPVEIGIKETTRHDDMRKIIMMFHSYCASEEAATNDNCNASQNCFNSDINYTNQALHIKTETESLPIDRQNDTFNFLSCPLKQEQEHLSFTLKEENDNEHRFRESRTSKVASEVEVGLTENDENTDFKDEENADSLPPGDTPYIPDFCTDLEDSDSSSSYGHHQNKKRQKKQTPDRNGPANTNLESDPDPPPAGSARALTVHQLLQPTPLFPAKVTDLAPQTLPLSSCATHPKVPVEKPLMPNPARMSLRIPSPSNPPFSTQVPVQRPSVARPSMPNPARTSLRIPTSSNPPFPTQVVVSFSPTANVSAPVLVSAHRPVQRGVSPANSRPVNVPLMTSFSCPTLVSALIGNNQPQVSPAQVQAPLQIVGMYVNQSRDLSLQKRLEQSWRSKPILPCRHCGAISRQPSLRVRHRYLHRGSRLYRCQCGRSFQRQLHLLRHQVQHAESVQFVCVRCGNTFKGAHKLSCHKLKHKNGKQCAQTKCGTAFDCSCGQIFTRPSALLWHMLKNSKHSKCTGNNL